MANIPFTTFEFSASGAPTSRTMPERLAEIYDVKDWGALGDNVQDDSPFFQDAMDAIMAAGGGTLFIPPGNYKLLSAITFNDDADFGLLVKGVGAASALFPAFSGFAFDRHLATPNNTFGPRVFESVFIQNSTAGGGCIRLGSTIGGAVRNCYLIAAGTCFTAEDEPGASSETITLDATIFTGSGTSAKGIVLGGNGVIVGNEISGFDESVRLYGNGISMQSNRMERGNTAVTLGVDSDDVDQGLNGFNFLGNTMEGNITFIEFKGTVTGFYLGAFGMTGHDSGNSGVSGATANTDYGILIRADKAYAGEIVGIKADQWFDVAAIYIEDFTTRSYVTFSDNTVAVGGGSGVPWRISTTTGGFAFINNNTIDSGDNAPSGTRYAFANITSPLEGDEYDLYDANTATLGATVSAGGSNNRVRVYYNGSAQIVASA